MVPAPRSVADGGQWPHAHSRDFAVIRKETTDGQRGHRFDDVLRQQTSWSLERKVLHHVARYSTSSPAPVASWQIVVLVIAGGLLAWGHSFANSNVHNQLAQPQIYFPPKAAFAHAKAGHRITPSMMIPSVLTITPASRCSRRAGQDLLERLHRRPPLGNALRWRLLQRSAPRQIAQPTNTKLAALKRHRSQARPCEACCSRTYAFSVIASIMLIGAIASFINWRQ